MIRIVISYYLQASGRITQEKKKAQSKSVSFCGQSMQSSICNLQMQSAYANENECQTRIEACRSNKQIKVAAARQCRGKPYSLCLVYKFPHPLIY
mgnify:CR=1 FL=1